GSQVTITQQNLAFGNYKWAYRAIDTSGIVSPWIEFGNAGNLDFSRVHVLNDYVRIDDLHKEDVGGTQYIYVKWTLLKKWNDAEVAVYPSLNNNLPSITLSSSFEPLFMGGNSLIYDQFRSLGNSLDQGYYLWKPVGSPCNDAGPGSSDYTVGNQYTTRFSRIFDMSTLLWVDALSITSTANIRFTIYDRTQFDASPCNMDFKEAYPDSADYHPSTSAPEKRPLIFIPGIAGSRLDDDGGTKIWPPPDKNAFVKNAFGNPFSASGYTRLSLDPSALFVPSNIVVPDVIRIYDQETDPAKRNVYSLFLCGLTTCVVFVE